MFIQEGLEFCASLLVGILGIFQIGAKFLHKGTYRLLVNLTGFFRK